jgi:nucleoside diphosphate kinase
MLHVSQLPPEVGFVLFKPDLFYRQLLVPVLQFLSKAGFKPLSFLTARVSDAHYKQMYSRQFLWDVDDWHHNRLLYAFGPGLGMLLHHEGGNAQELLSQLKGAALPSQRKEGSLRKTFSSKSRVLNLIHVPDGRAWAEKEALHWFGGNLSLDLTSCEEIVAELECFHCSEAHLRLDPEEIFLIAKLRLLHACRNSKDCPEQFKEPLKQASLFYRRWQNALLSEPACVGIEGTLLLDLQQEEVRFCQQLLTTSALDQNRKQAIEVLSVAATLKYISNFFWILDEWNVYLSELERYLIHCRLKYQSSHPSSE